MLHASSNEVFKQNHKASQYTLKADLSRQDWRVNLAAILTHGSAYRSAEVGSPIRYRIFI
jgi:hypothetical protein